MDEPTPLVQHYLDVVDLMELLVRRRLPRWAMFGKGLNEGERRALAEKFAAAHALTLDALAKSMSRQAG
jgi:hypothetical protein